MKRCGLLGEKLGHSFSPQIHSRLSDYEYRLYEVAPDKLDDFMKTTELDGFNVTIPYKKAVIPYCARLSPRAEKLGSVNTVLRLSDGTFYGDNTDYCGFEYMMKKSGVDLHGKKALVLGNGGAALTVRAVLTDLGAGSVITVSRRGEDNYENLFRHYDAAVVINTTPLGMYPHNGTAAIDLAPFKDCEFVGDLIYNPYKTALLLQAEKLNIPCANGLSMLVSQAKAASEIFTGKDLPDEAVMEITDEISGSTRNVVLVGMPGSGKTTVGGEFAKLTGRRLVDTDELIVERAGMAIPEIFARDGEEAFRNIETEILAEVSKQSGLIISTGGGVVTKERNRDLIAQNSFCVFIHRDIESLPTEGRPVSQNRDLAELYRERRENYIGWSDMQIENTAPKATAAAIMEMLKL